MHTGNKFASETDNGMICKCMDCAKKRAVRMDYFRAEAARRQGALAAKTRVVRVDVYEDEVKLKSLDIRYYEGQEFKVLIDTPDGVDRSYSTHVGANDFGPTDEDDPHDPNEERHPSHDDESRQAWQNELPLP